MTDIDRAGFRRLVDRGEPLLIQWCPDALTARLCEQLSYDGGYLGGGGLGYSMAISEALLSVTELATATWQIRRRSQLPLIVDGGVGFGDPIHVTRMVWELENAGAHAIEIEDQVAPKRASHHRHVEHLIPQQEMAAKIKFAVEARRDPDLLIIARTGAVQNESFVRAIERLQIYLEAGADVAMLLPDNEEQLAAAPALIAGPVAILTSFDLCTPEEWRRLGYAILIDAVTGQTAAFTALREAYELQKAGKPSGRKASEAFAVYEGFQELAGLDELYDIERATTEREI